MDLVSSLIGLGLVMLTILPFVYFHFSLKKKKQEFIKEYLGLAAQHQAVITQYDVWSNYFAIGMDRRSNKLFYYRKLEGKEEKALINLSDIAKCRVHNLKKTQNGDQVIDRLELVFTYRNAKSPEQALMFFSKEEFMTHNGELQLVEKWSKEISLLLDAKRDLSLAN